LAHESEAYHVDHDGQYNQRQPPCPVEAPRQRADHEEVERGLANSHREPRHS